ncbi:MAG: hypothetical protein EBS69_04915 [Verrucomicrobia bacterium]|nr:hypothetical protein [Verrucomicrobiota bacterium]NBS78943.1 hypothetical protein [bacterium]NBT23430.1 hypothetical protein [bacterium]NBV96362.1 hypothetical protein [Verrucomicrobiota bacterium]
MKVNWSRTQVISAAVGAGFLVLAAVAGWMGWGALGEAQNQAQALSDRKTKPELAAILSRPGGAGAARKEAGEVAKLAEELGKTEEGLVESWRQGYSEASGEGQGWSQDANQWKDQLIGANDRLRKRSGKKGDSSRVTLADDFYLGLQEFKQQNPPGPQVPALARQLSVSEKLVGLLMEAKKTSQEGYPTLCLLQSMQGPALPVADGTKPGGDKAKTATPVGGFLRESYTMQFECSPEVLYSFVQRLARDPWLFIVADLNLENDLKEFPKRSEVAKKFADASKPAEVTGGSTEGVRGGANAATRPPLLMVLAGKERLKVLMRVDFVGWKSAVPGKQPEKGKSS